MTESGNESGIELGTESGTEHRFDLIRFELPMPSGIETPLWIRFDLIDSI